MDKATNIRLYNRKMEQHLINLMSENIDIPRSEMEVIIKQEINNTNGAIEYFKRAQGNETKIKDHFMAYDPDEDESEYMKDIIGYDGDFNQKAKIWTKSFISEIKPEDQLKNYYAIKSNKDHILCKVEPTFDFDTMFSHKLARFE